MIYLTHAYFLNDDPKEQAIMKPYAPLGILYISAFLDQHQVPNQVFDTTFSSFEEQKASILLHQPTIIAVYTNLMTKLNVLKLITWIRSQPSLSETTIVVGGPEVRHHDENFLLNGVDVVVSGEGEQTMLDLWGWTNGMMTLSDIEGISFTSEGITIRNKERTLIKNIDELPFPNRTKIDLSMYFSTWKKHHGYSMASISTMRGCPYTCKWCSRAVYGGTYRRRNPKLVVDEIVWMQQEYEVDRYWFVDDVFTISHKWLEAFAQEIESRGIKISYEIISRADRMNLDVIQLLKKSGCSRVWIGAESGSQRIIDAMDRRVDVHQVRKMIQETNKAGIETGTFIMVGYPGETLADIEETVLHLKEANPDVFTITVAYPITGTPLFDEVKEKLTVHAEWATITDRDLDFSRTHSRVFYEHAVRYIYNEVNSFKQLQKRKPAFVKLKLKSLVSKYRMLKAQ